MNRGKLMPATAMGIDRLREGEWKKFKSRNLLLLANQASLDRRLEPSWSVIAQTLPGRLKGLLGPQHGFGGEDQDNMVETPHARDEETGLPVYSLYAETRAPLPFMLEGVDCLMVDLQDVGTRVYTFASTLLNCMRAAAEAGVGVAVLDRPNPLGGRVIEGNLLQEDFFSFVGPARLPMRHGLTMGEMALLFKETFSIECDLEIIAMGGWERRMLWSDTGLRWLMPSPNMPLFETALVYPGQVALEGTNLSEGRGTCRPFEIFGAPYIDRKAVLEALSPACRRGIRLQPFTFRPTFNKWHHQLCKGFMIHVLDPGLYEPYLTSLALIQSIAQVHPGDFAWKEPPYEYEYKKKPIDLIMGDDEFRKGLENGIPVSRLKERWHPDLSDYGEWRRPFLLYT